MGGIGSGQQRKTHSGIVEDVPQIDMRVLRRLGLLKPGECTIDTLRWSNGGLPAAEVRVRVDLERLDAGTATFAMVGTATLPQIVLINAIACRYGGHRFYFKCPDRDRRCEVLYLKGGRFASRQSHRLSYAVQVMNDLSRARKQRRKLRARLDAQGIFPRPRGRHRHALAERFHAAEEVERMLAARAIRTRLELKL